MNWFAQTLTSTIGRKIVMALTGLFLCSFLVVHLIGNLQLLKGDEGQSFNFYTQFMVNSPIIKTIAWVNYAMILLHVIQSILLTRMNQKARPVGYAYNNPSANSTWSSRNMGILGSIILAFIVLHMRGFWYEMHFGEVPMTNYPGAKLEDGVKDLYRVVKAAYAQWWIVAIYVVSMITIGIHLAHGFSSAFQTLGLHHNKYNTFLHRFGQAFAIIIALGFAVIPVWMFIEQMLEKS